MRRPRILGDRLGRKVDALRQKPGQERPAHWYDGKFSRTRAYQSAYNLSPYYFLWAVIVDRIRRDGLRRVLDIGCGTGQLAAFLFDQGIDEYVGLDFSTEAIAQARRVAPHGRFVVDDAREANVYSELEYDVLICTEVLEHIADDLGVVSKFAPDKRCIFSVPSFPSASHVRHFSDREAVIERYAPYFASIDVVAFPVGGSETGRFFLGDGYRNKTASSGHRIETDE